VKERECGEEQETRPFAVQLKVEYRWEVEKNYAELER